ncbi:MAG TPA: hypothetical protein DHV22_01365, partial [Xanthomarina gelatinilytica]|nr:hypothetical protein [Xanthomarina gelatinilytica]
MSNNFEYSEIDWHYFGLLEEVDLNKFDESKIDLLIKKNIIQKYKPLFKDIKLSNYTILDFANIVNDESEYIYGNSLLLEIYHALKLYVKFVKCEPIEEIKRELSKLNAFLDADV